MRKLRAGRGWLQVEKAQGAIKEEDAAAMMRKMLSNKFDFNDFLSQYKSVNKMGSLGSVMKMIPGMGGVDDKQLVEVEKKYAVYESVIAVRRRRRPESLLVQTSPTRVSPQSAAVFALKEKRFLQVAFGDRSEAELP